MLVLGIVYFSLKSGLFVQKLSVPGMVELQFAERAGLGSTAKPEQANDPELKVNQAQLEQKLSVLERRLAERDVGTGAASVNGGGIAVPSQPITSLYGR